MHLEVTLLFKFLSSQPIAIEGPFSSSASWTTQVSLGALFSMPY
jgi:hypothetical protein